MTSLERSGRSNADVVLLGTSPERTDIELEQAPFSRMKKPVVPGTEKDDENKAGDGPEVTAVESKKDVSFLQLFRFTTKFELLMNFIGICCAIVAGAAQPLMSVVFGNLTQSFVNFGTAVQNVQSGNGTSADVEAAAAGFRHTASKDALLLVYIGIGMMVTTFVYMYNWIYTGEVASKRIRENYLKAVLRQDIAYFDNVGAGEVTSRIQMDTHLIQQGISEKVALSVQYISSFLAGFIVAYIRSWRLALALSSMLPCIGIAGGIANTYTSKYTQESLDKIAEGGTVAEEIISTVRTAHAFGTQRTLADIYDTYIDRSHAVEKKAAIFIGVSVGLFFFIVYSAYGLAFNFGTTLVLHGHASVGIIVNVFLAILNGSFSLAMLQSHLEDISQASGAASKLWATMDRVPSIDSQSPEGLKPESLVGEITVENVDFSYPSRPDVPVVQNLSLRFPAGRTCALVGASGSGKSTIISLVERFYDPLSGSVKLDGIDLRELNVKWLRGQIGLVSQEPILFATTIAENVAHGLIGTPWEHASEEEKMKLIKEACVTANADGFISNLPLGYETLVGERGFLLSGGQKQRIAIARAVVGDPRILLLDEATSALDTQSEGIVQDALDRAAAGRTTITIAHRLSTIKDADNIYVMGGGVVLEQGTHNELVAENGHYALLVRAQKLREGTGHDTERALGGDQGEITKVNAATGESSSHPVWKQEFSPAHSNIALPNTADSVAQMHEHEELRESETDFSLIYIFQRFGLLEGRVWKRYAFGAIFASISGMIYPAFGIVYSIAITAFQEADDPIKLRHSGDRNALWFFLIAIVATFTLTIHNYEFSAAAADLTRTLRSLSFRAILRQDIKFFDKDKNNSGTLTASLSDNSQKVNGLVGVTLGVIVQSISTIATGSIIGLVFQWRLALISIACMPLIVSAGYIQLRVVVLKDQKNKKEHEQSAQLACEAAGAIRTVASLTREEDCVRIYGQSLEAPLRRSNRSALYSNIFYATSQAMMFFVIALVFWYGAQEVSKQKFGATAFFVCLFSVTFGAIQVGNVFAFVPDISSAKGSGSDIIRLLDSRPEIDAESPEGEILKQVQGHIRFENVQFRYPNRPDVRVLRGLNLEIKPGTFVALVGASGCGKSTAIQLIERFYDPLGGRVLLDGYDIAKLNVQEYRKHIALVSQEPTLYAGTIRFNILLGATKPAEKVTQEEIEAACRDANILDFINSLPDGFDTNVGGKGSQLSGGQKQRIAIARALIRNPKVLLLDEATSALDSNSEKVVQEALDQAAKGRTTLAIAHRLATIQNADCIFFVKEGRVTEAGSHDQLLALKGDYYEYVQLQALSRK